MDEDGKRASKKTTSAVFLLVFAFKQKYGYSLRHHSTKQWEETSLIKYCKMGGVYCMWNDKEDFANTGSDTKPCTYCILLQVVGEEM